MENKINSLPATELVGRWIKTENPEEEAGLRREIEWRLKAGNGEPIAALMGIYQNAFLSSDRLPPKKGAKILSDMESAEMTRIWSKAKSLLGDDGAEIIRKMDTGNPQELMRRLVKTKRENGLQKARLAGRR